MRLLGLGLATWATIALGCGPSGAAGTPDGDSTGSSGSSEAGATASMPTTFDPADSTADSTADAAESSSDSATNTTGDPSDSGTTMGVSAGSESAGSTDAGDNGTTVGDASTGPDESTDGTTDATTNGTGQESTGPGTDSGDTGPGLAPDGEPCELDAECQSNECFVVGALGGTCGECNEDSDCPLGGCTPPDPIGDTPSACNVGLLGDGCETTASCGPGLLCGEVINVPGIITVSTCGECEDDADCGADSCQPDYNVVELTGVLECTAAGTLADGHGCNPDTGATACTSGHCPTATVMGILELGICSECTDDGDCAVGSCQAPQIDPMTGLIAGVCA